MSRSPRSAEDHERVRRALTDGVQAVQDRIAPLWARTAKPLSDRQRIVRARVTRNAFRELDVLLAHWVGLVARRPVRMSAIDHWRERDGDASMLDLRFTPEEVVRLAADYHQVAPSSSGLPGCERAA
ncbi:hypothetical protein RN629_13410 [Sphingomonadaceae bacterium jetA1]|uniref:hypothetical protein n=1 Tax=Facivitalis istanbulensis TaxID=3075838 RepID=UPI00347C5D30